MTTNFYFGDVPPRRREVLENILSYRREYGFSPSYQELADAMGLASTAGIMLHVRKLVETGFLQERKAGAARSLVPTFGEER